VEPGRLALALLLLILPVLAYLTARVRAGRAGELRPIPGLEALPESVGRSAEIGRPLHVSVGVEGLGGQATAHTWAGLALLAQLADEAAACNCPLIVTVADPTVLPMAQDILRTAFARRGNPDGYEPTSVRYVAPLPLAYAAGVAGLVDRQPLTANVMAGSFGDEYLLIGEVGVRHGVHQVAGTANPATLPLMMATAEETLVGEEVFAAGAYTRRLPSQVASLLTEDWARWIVVATILVAAVINVLTTGQ
jgi:hypothetical protein